MSSVIRQPALSAGASSWRRTAEILATVHFAPFAEEPERDQRYPWENVAKPVDSGITGLFIPAAHGGVGATLSVTAAAVKAIGMGCSSTAATVRACQVGAFPAVVAGRKGAETALGQLAEAPAKRSA